MTAYGTEFFSMRDVNRLRILQDVIDRNLRPGLAAEMLGFTPRHCSRLLKRYRQSGPLGMNNQARLNRLTGIAIPLPDVSASMQPLKRQIFCLRRSCPLLWIAIPILKSILWPATEWLT